MVKQSIVNIVKKVNIHDGKYSLILTLLTMFFDHIDYAAWPYWLCSLTLLTMLHKPTKTLTTLTKFPLLSTFYIAQKVTRFLNRFFDQVGLYGISYVSTRESETDFQFVVNKSSNKTFLLLYLNINKIGQL